VSSTSPVAIKAATSPISAELAAALAQADVLIDNGPDAVAFPKLARPLIVNEIDWLNKQKSPSLPRKGAQEAGGWGSTKQGQLEADGVLHTFNLGPIKHVSTRDIARYRIAMVLLSYPLDGPPTKIRQPRERFKPHRRKPTERELEGLRIGNAKRAAAAEEARKRREAKQAARA
jgi:hypothetical protein